MKKVRMILVGGFLGAGKTTLLHQAAGRLAARGQRVGLITNDQAPDLVDTGLLAQQGLAVQEVAGSCFCCNFPGLIRAADTLGQEIQADVLIAEPVGSCTDLSATILQPLKAKFANEFSLAPLTVVADPHRLVEVYTAGSRRLHDSAAYIFRKQLEEADLILVNKCDLLSSDEAKAARELLAVHYPDTPSRMVSALTGEGVDEWLDALQGQAGRRVVEMDYDTYAEGEAVLGWLNGALTLASVGETARWKDFLADFMNELHEALRQQSAEVGHVKALMWRGDERCFASLTRIDGPIATRGDVSETAGQCELIINARAEISPEDLESLVRQQLAGCCDRHGLRSKIGQMRSLRPGRPVPTYRYDAAVAG